MIFFMRFELEEEEWEDQGREDNDDSADDFDKGWGDEDSDDE